MPVSTVTFKSVRVTFRLIRRPKPGSRKNIYIMYELLTTFVKTCGQTFFYRPYFFTFADSILSSYANAFLKEHGIKFSVFLAIFFSASFFFGEPFFLLTPVVNIDTIMFSCWLVNAIQPQIQANVVFTNCILLRNRFKFFVKSAVSSYNFKTWEFRKLRAFEFLFNY